MKKIKSLFMRNYETDRMCRNEVVPGSEWVLAGEGVATVKFDGTACMIRNGEIYKRYDAKNGKVPPEGFEPAQDPDPVTGHWPGWLKCDPNNPADRWHFEGLEDEDYLEDGTYELIGLKVSGNPYGLLGHYLIRHGSQVLEGCPRDYENLIEYLKNPAIEGIVFHHPDGRMVKAKRKDFGFKWPVKEDQ